MSEHGNLYRANRAKACLDKFAHMYIYGTIGKR